MYNNRGVFGRCRQHQYVDIIMSSCELFEFELQCTTFALFQLTKDSCPDFLGKSNIQPSTHNLLLGSFQPGNERYSAR